MSLRVFNISQSGLSKIVMPIEFSTINAFLGNLSMDSVLSCNKLQMRLLECGNSSHIRPFGQKCYVQPSSRQNRNKFMSISKVLELL